MSQLLSVGSLFAGIGGFELGLEMTGHFKTVWQVEIDDYAREVLAKHWPGVRRHADVRTFPTDHNWECHVICGGFPCTDISAAGRRKGLDGKNSRLFYELARVVSVVRPQYVIMENVSALLTRGMGDVLGTMVSLGYDCQWHCISAAAVGAPHIRDRIFILAYRSSARTQTGLAGKTCERLRNSKIADYCSYGTGGQEGWSEVGWWSAEPSVGRMVHGVPRRVDRIRCLGNAIVPQVAYVVGEILWEVHCEQDVFGKS